MHKRREEHATPFIHARPSAARPGLNGEAREVFIFGPSPNAPAVPAITIAIDGRSSCGKSTLAKDLAQALGYGYVDSGAMYRAVTHYFQEHNISLEDEAAVKGALENIQISFRHVGGQNCTFLNDENVEGVIRTLEVSNFVSEIAEVSAIRSFLVAQQKALGKGKGIVMDGRDIGTVVFPDAELKIFLTSDAYKRAERRFQELQTKGMQGTVQEVIANLQKRDRIDSTRKDSPLRKAADAVQVDNTNITRKEQAAMVLALAKERVKAL